MTAIQELIETNYPNLGINTENGRLVNDGKKVLDFVYTDLVEKFKEKFGGTITKTQVKEEVQRYAAEHPWTSEEKKKKQKKFESWSSELDFDENDMPKKTLKNTIEFFSKNPKYKNCFTFNEFTQFENYNGEPIEDWMIGEFRLECEKVMGYNTKDLVEAAVIKVCHDNSFHPFKDAIKKLKWDGTERLDTFFIKYLGGEDTELNRSMTRKFFYAMMKRLFEPGCDFDNMLIIADPTQGTGKTKLLMRIPSALGIPYGCDATISCDLKDKDNVDKLNRCWIAIIDELSNFLKRDPETTKQFLSQSMDVARLSYARRSQMFYRHNVFFATTNLDYFLKDYASEFERRYWIIDAHGTPHDAQWWKDNLPDDEVRQLVAEAYKFYKENPDYEYTSLSLAEQDELRKVQRGHKTLCNDDVLQDQILRAINLTMKETQFSNAREFINAIHCAENRVDTFDPRTDEFLGLAGDEVEMIGTEYTQMETIPSSWLREWIKTDLKRDVSAGYLAQLLSDEFEYQQKGHYKKKDGSWLSTSTFKRK